MKKSYDLSIKPFKDAVIDIVYSYDLPANDKDISEAISRFAEDIDNIVYGKK